jgi:hypothetical protein
MWCFLILSVLEMIGLAKDVIGSMRLRAKAYTAPTFMAVDLGQLG